MEVLHSQHREEVEAAWLIFKEELGQLEEQLFNHQAFWAGHSKKIQWLLKEKLRFWRKKISN